MKLTSWCWVAAALIAAGCGSSQKPSVSPAAARPTPPAAAQAARENAEPKTVTQARPRVPGPTAGVTPAPSSANPWASRTDLFVAPKPTVTANVQLGSIERFTMNNGLKVIAMPRRQIASVDVVVAIRAGRTADPLDKGGLAQFTASMLRKGTQKRSSDQIAQAIDSVGGEVQAQADVDATYVGCHARAKDLGLCLDLLSDMAQRAAFPEKEMDEIRRQLYAEVDHVKDNPRLLAEVHGVNLFFGDRDPRGRPMSRESIAAVDRLALVDFYRSRYAPNNAIVAVAGDFDGRALRTALTRYFGKWPTRLSVPDPPVLGLPSHPKPLTRLVDKPDATQSVLAILGPGIAHDSPDFYAVQLMNYTLGGGAFSSRLMKVVRSEGGKTYGVRSRFEALRNSGFFEAATFTRNPETASTLRLVLDEIKRMRAGGPTEAELEAAKANLIGGYGLHLETANDLSHALLAAEIDGLDADYVRKYPQRLAAVTHAGVVQAAQRYLAPNTLVVVGRAADVKPLLAAIGVKPDDEVAYTDPVSPSERRGIAQAKAKAQQVSPEEADTGKKLLATALAAKGGAAELSKIRDLQTRGQGTMRTSGQSIPIIVERAIIPGKAERTDIVLSTLNQRMAIVVANGKAFQQVGDQVQDLPAGVAAEMQKGLWRDSNFILLHASEPGSKVKALDPVTENGVKYDVLEIISPDGDSTRLLLDSKTHLIARELFKQQQQEGRIELSDYRREGGIAFAQKMILPAGNGQELELRLEKIEINKGIKPDLFKR